MRKLKKSLVVLLILAMALTIAPFAGANPALTTGFADVTGGLQGAAGGITVVASFDDADDVTPAHVQALDVLAAVNVLRGEDGRILPNRNVTRAEAATIVARVLLGPNVADDLPPATSGFRDVDGVSGLAFASGAIAYLADHGIVVGIGDGLFNPNGSVTGAEMATMLLRAVGFGVNGEYEGPRWEANAIVDGMNWRVLTGNYDFTAAATREQVFRFAFNALNHSNLNTHLRFVNWSADRQAYVPVLLQGIAQDGSGDGGNLMTLWQRVFTTRGAASVASSDILGRPATRFTLWGRQIGLYPTAPRLSFTSFQSELAVRTAIDGFEIPATVNGIVNGSNTLLPGSSPNIRGQNNNNLAQTISNLSGNGVLLEIWVSPFNEITAVSAIRTDISQVTAINSARTHWTLTVLSNDLADGVVRTAGFGNAESIVVDNLHPLFDEISELTLGERVLVTPTFRNTERGEVAIVDAPEVITGRLNSSATMINLLGNTGSLTVDGTLYRRARVLTANARAAIMTGPGIDITIYLDTHGYLVDTLTAGVAARSMMFVRATANGLHGGALTPMVRGWFPDGTVADVLITGAGGNLIDTIPTLGRNDVDNLAAGSVIRLHGSGGNVTWNYAQHVDWAPAPVGPGTSALPTPPGFVTIPATRASLYATVVSLNATGNVNIVANQATLVVGGQNLRFADDARYFFWGDHRTNPVPPAEHSFAIATRANSINNIPAENIRAVVEYRVPGQRPVISALWIVGTHEIELTAANLVFMHLADQGGGSAHTIYREGLMYQTFRASNWQARPISWNQPANWFPPDYHGSWVAIQGDNHGQVNNSGWYLFSVDNQDRFVLTAAPPNSGTTLRVLDRVPTLANGIAMPTPAAPLGILPILVDGAIVSLSVDLNTPVVSLLDDRFRDPVEDEYFSIDNIGQLIRAIQLGYILDIGAAFNPSNANMASAIFVYGVTP